MMLATAANLGAPKLGMGSPHWTKGRNWAITTHHPSRSSMGVSGAHPPLFQALSIGSGVQCLGVPQESHVPEVRYHTDPQYGHRPSLLSSDRKQLWQPPAVSQSGLDVSGQSPQEPEAGSHEVHWYVLTQQPQTLPRVPWPALPQSVVRFTCPGSTAGAVAL